MASKEQRSEMRFSFTHKPKGMLFLHVRGECLPVRSIRDISQTGVSLLIDYEISKGDHVEVEYKDRENGVKVSGIVVWQSQPDASKSEAKHLLGISMFNPNMLLSFMQIA
jgi:PilZ domain